MQRSTVGGNLWDTAMRPSSGGKPRMAALAGDPPAANRPGRGFDLLRWFSITSLLALIPSAALTGAILSHFITEQALRREALLTVQFIRNVIGETTLDMGPGAKI